MTGNNCCCCCCCCCSGGCCASWRRLLHVRRRRVCPSLLWWWLLWLLCYRTRTFSGAALRWLRARAAPNGGGEGAERVADGAEAGATAARRRARGRGRRGDALPSVVLPSGVPTEPLRARELGRPPFGGRGAGSFGGAALREYQGCGRFPRGADLVRPQDPPRARRQGGRRWPQPRGRARRRGRPAMRGTGP